MLNRRREVEPQQGEIWRDADGQHSLILETFGYEVYSYAHVLCLDTGANWTHEPFKSWDNPLSDGLPYYRELVG